MAEENFHKKLIALHIQTKSCAKDVAGFLGISAQMYCRWLSGDAKPHPQMAQLVLKALEKKGSYDSR